MKTYVVMYQNIYYNEIVGIFLNKDKAINQVKNMCETISKLNDTPIEKTFRNPSSFTNTIYSIKTGNEREGKYTFSVIQFNTD